jgi:hypothetical protein
MHLRKVLAGCVLLASPTHVELIEGRVEHYPPSGRPTMLAWRRVQELSEHWSKTFRRSQLWRLDCLDGGASGTQAPARWVDHEPKDDWT